MDKVAPGTKVLYALGCPPAAGLPALEVVPSTVLMVMNGSRRENGLRGEYYGRGEFKGDPARIALFGHPLGHRLTLQPRRPHHHGPLVRRAPQPALAGGFQQGRIARHLAARD